MFLSINQLSIHNTIISQPPKLLLEVLLKGVKSIKDLCQIFTDTQIKRLKNIEAAK